MSTYVGLDVSQKETEICVVDVEGRRIWRGKCRTEPNSIAVALREHAGGAVRIGMETGPLSIWLWRELRALGLKVDCIHARRVAAALSLQVNKTDANRTTLSNQIRGLLKTFGVVLAPGKGGTFDKMVLSRCPEDALVRSAIEALLCAWRVAGERQRALDAQLIRIARASEVCHRMTSVPGVGAITALTFATTIDDPKRFGRSTDVGAYLGLTPRRYQSGEVDIAGRISKSGDRAARSLLFEAANTLLTRAKKDSDLRQWGLTLMIRIGAKKAKVAVARKLAVILHCIWTDGTAFEGAR